MFKVIQQLDKNEFFEMLDKENRWAEKIGLKESDISDAIKTVRASRKTKS